MKILIATFNYYPLHSGGTEVFVQDLVQQQLNQGQEVLIVAASNSVALMQQGITTTLVHTTHSFEAFMYQWQKVSVLGVSLQEDDMLVVHQKWTAYFEIAFKECLQKIGWQQPDVLWMHGLNGVCGVSLAMALLQLNPHLPVKMWLHTTFTCFKGTLTTVQYTTCEQKPDKTICKQCYVQTVLGKWGNIYVHLEQIFPFIKLVAPAPIKRLDEFLHAHYQSIQRLVDIVTEWYCFTPTMMPHLLALGIAKEKIQLKTHTINPAIFNNKGRTVTTVHRFLYNGRFAAIKGFSILAKAWLMLTDEPHKRILTITGDTNNAPKALKKYIIRLQQRNDVKWKGFLNQTAMAALYKEQDFVIIPSLCVETGPLVFHEAIASGCKVMASAIGGNISLASKYPNEAILFKTASNKDLKHCITQSSTHTNVS